MKTVPTTASTTLATLDQRPFFEKALRYGVGEGLITPLRQESLQEELARGTVQIAQYFGTAHLRPELELARHRMVNLISLYLEYFSDGDLPLAAKSLSDKTLLAHSKAGSEMLKRLHAMPESAVLLDDQRITPEEQRAELDDKTAARTLSLAAYRAEYAARQENQCHINLAYWLGVRMGVARRDMDDADSLIQSAMLVLFVEPVALKIPSRTSFVRLLKAAQKSAARLNEAHFKAFFKEVPEDLREHARQAMEHFLTQNLPQIRALKGQSIDQLLHSESGASRYFIQANLDDDARAYHRLVAREWDRVTRGESDDPAVLATVFLLIATGFAPKASLLKREAKALVRVFRNSGLDSKAVRRFISEHAPASQHDDLNKFWADDLQPEAEQQLADIDPLWPDTHMDRALNYLKKTCCATWKGR